MPTSGRKKESVIKASVKTEEITIKTKPLEIKKMSDEIKNDVDKGEEAITNEDFQNFVSAFNEGVRGMIKPLREKQKELERKLDELKNVTASKEILDLNVTKFNDEMEKVKKDFIGHAEKINKISEQAKASSFSLEEMVLKIPQISSDLQEFMKIVQNLVAAWRSVFGSAAKAGNEVESKISAHCAKLEEKKIPEVVSVPVATVKELTPPAASKPLEPIKPPAK